MDVTANSDEGAKKKISKEYIWQVYYYKELHILSTQH